MQQQVLERRSHEGLEQTSPTNTYVVCGLLCSIHGSQTPYLSFYLISEHQLMWNFCVEMGSTTRTQQYNTS